MRKTNLDPDLVDISQYNKFWLELFWVLERLFCQYPQITPYSAYHTFMIKHCVGWCIVLTNTTDCVQTKCRGRGALAMVDDREQKYAKDPLKIAQRKTGAGMGVMTVSYCDVISRQPPGDPRGEMSFSPLYWPKGGPFFSVWVTFFRGDWQTRAEEIYNFNILLWNISTACKNQFYLALIYSLLFTVNCGWCGI